jgi:two-component system cell cycle response regulator
MKILVVDDQPVFRRLIEAALQKAGHEVVLMQDGKQAWQALEQGEYDLAVLDWLMPEMDGVTLCRKLRQRIGARYLYIILLTAKDELEDVVKGLDAGADEYLVKPFNPEELRARVRAGGRIVELERRLSQANAQLAALASTDELTGLMNRRAILKRLEEESGRSLLERRRLSVVLVDLDGLKQINDRYGHAAGDAVLKEASQRLMALLRPYDSLGRLGGDELLLLLPGASEAEAQASGQRMCDALAAPPFLVEPDLALQVTGACGVAEVETGCDTRDTLLRADQALYAAKRQGGNRVEVASSVLAAARTG